MKVYCSGKARIRHEQTGKVHAIRSEELNWDLVGGDERQMGQENHYQAVIEHSHLGVLRWSLWEYPVGIENYRDSDVGKHQIIEDFDYGLQHEEPPPDDWVAYPIPKDPFTIFLASYGQTRDLLTSHGSFAGTDLLNRMVFSHQITALEAYLGDTLINEVLRDVNAITRLIQNDSDLKQMKFTLPEIAANPDIVKDRVRDHLRSILYHNLPKVDALYGIALQLRILPLAGSEKDDLFQAVNLRHDCVHRNGVDRDGNTLTVFDEQFVQDRADLIKDFVEKIENAVRSRVFPSAIP
jgi:hypothetical protein